MAIKSANALTPHLGELIWSSGLPLECLSWEAWSYSHCFRGAVWRSTAPGPPSRLYVASTWAQRWRHGNNRNVAITRKHRVASYWRNPGHGMAAAAPQQHSSFSTAAGQQRGLPAGRQ